MSDRYIVVVEGLNLEEGRKTNLPNPPPFKERHDFTNFRQAFDVLQQFDNRSFDERLATRQNLEKHIKLASILTEGGEVMVMKQNKISPMGSSLPSGVYLEINTSNISVDEFQKQTGMQLTNFIKKGPMLDYYLVVKTADLRQVQTDHLSKSNIKRSKIIKGDRGKGKSLS